MRYVLLVILAFTTRLSQAVTKLPLDTKIHNLNTDSDFSALEIYFNEDFTGNPPSFYDFYKNQYCRLIQFNESKRVGGNVRVIKKGTQLKVSKNKTEENELAWFVWLVLEKKDPYMFFYFICRMPKDSFSYDEITIGTLTKYSKLPIVFFN